MTHILKKIFASADVVYVDAMNNTNSAQWNITVVAEAHSVLFKVDAGAEVTALSENTYNLLQHTVPRLHKPIQILTRCQFPLEVVSLAQIYTGSVCYASSAAYPLGTTS